MLFGLSLPQFLPQCIDIGIPHLGGFVKVFADESDWSMYSPFGGIAITLQATLGQVLSIENGPNC